MIWYEGGLFDEGDCLVVCECYIIWHFRGNVHGGEWKCLQVASWVLG